MPDSRGCRTAVPLVYRVPRIAMHGALLARRGECETTDSEARKSESIHTEATGIPGTTPVPTESLFNCWPRTSTRMLRDKNRRSS